MIMMIIMTRFGSEYDGVGGYDYDYDVGCDDDYLYDYNDKADDGYDYVADYGCDDNSAYYRWILAAIQVPDLGIQELVLSIITSCTYR